MSRSLTHEQVLLNKADQLLINLSPVYEQRLIVLEAYAALLGGFDVDEYWKAFNIEVQEPGVIKRIAEQLSTILATINIPASLALSSLAREPISISEKKQRGAFYTDYRLAKFVAEDCQDIIKPSSKVADIASGTGTLLAAIAELYHDLFPASYDQWIAENVYAYDLSEYALRGARIALSVHINNVKTIVKMCHNWVVCDSLLVDDPLFPKFDIVVGNPPWGKVKLSLHAFVNKNSTDYHVYGSGYGDFDKAKYLTEKQGALNYSKTLRERYSLLKNTEPDLYMAFLQRATDVLKPDGHLSYIVPAGLIRSLGAESFRRFLISCSAKLKYYLLDNQASFFEIDTRFKFIVISLNKVNPCEPGCDRFSFAICSGNPEGVFSHEEIQFFTEELERIRPDLTIPECRSTAEKELFIKICDNNLQWKDEWKVDITREVDMTNDRSRFHKKESSSDIPVIEGRMVQQFRFGAKAYVSGQGRSAKWSPSAEHFNAQYYLGSDNLNDQLRDRIYQERAGYCDIAGQTNERAMMSAVIPTGVVCGNKVPTIIFPDEAGEDRLYFFIGVTNSFVFDWLLRRVLSTTVNYFLLFSLPMPNVDISSEIAKTIITLSKKLTSMKANYYIDRDMGAFRAQLDIAVAEAYGLDFNDLRLVLEDFPLLDRHQPAIKGESRSTYTKDLLLSKAQKLSGYIEEPFSSRAKLAEDIGALAYIPSEMAELSKGGTR